MSADPQAPESLRHFMDGMSHYLADPDDDRLTELHARFPDWHADPKRVRIYAGHARGNLAGLLNKVFQSCQEALPPQQWRELIRAYYRTRPSTHYRLNRAAAGFPDFLRQRPELPPWFADLAQLQWTMIEIYASQTELPEDPPELTVNPTLQTFESPWDLVNYHRQTPCEGEPEPTPSVALLWRNPRSLRTLARTATPRHLLALKIAIEGISIEQAAREGGVEPADVWDVLEEKRHQGLIFGPLDRPDA